MNRSIKFRAWQQYNLQMFQVIGLKWDTNIFRKFSELTLTSLDEFRAIRTVIGEACDNYILMQYTGLKDEHGKEIYEGDIVTWDGFGIHYTRVVTWDNDEAMFMPNSMKDGVKIIGNIYEHPDLLSEAQ